MTLYMQLTDAAGVLHEIEMPAHCEGGSMTRVDELEGQHVLRLDTPNGKASVVLPDDYSPTWQIAGWRRQ